MHGEVEVTFWGTRGSMAAPYPDRMLYGGNTSCVSVKWKNGLVILDGGTGICGLGKQLLDRQSDDGEKKEIHIFISHLHLDHIIGLPLFPLLFQKDWTIHFYGAAHTEQGFWTELETISQVPYWPVSLGQAKARVIGHTLVPKERVGLLEDASVYCMEADHPNGGLLYRLEVDGISLVYGMDCEWTQHIAKDYEDFVQGCDLLIFDGMYTDAEYPQKKGFGHSTWEQGLRVKQSCCVEKLIISHHDWGRSDEELRQMEQELQQLDANAEFAKEGKKYYLRKRG